MRWFARLPSTGFLRHGGSGRTGLGFRASFDRLPSTGFLRQASFDTADFDRLRTNGVGVQGFLRRASFASFAGFLRRASTGSGRTVLGFDTASFDRLRTNGVGVRGFLRRASFDGLPPRRTFSRTNGVGVRASFDGLPSTGFLRRAQDERG